MKWRSQLTLATFLLSAALTAEAAARVGIVSDFEGTPDNFELYRDGSQVRVARMMDLFNGDQIAAKSPAKPITLAFGPKPEDAVVVCHAQAANNLHCSVKGVYTVNSVSQGQAKISALLADIGLALTYLAGQQSSSVVETRVRGYTKISLPLLEGEKRVVSGTRNLQLAWQGGEAPFQVTLRSPTGAELHSQSVTGRQLDWQQVQLAPGAYTLTVQDQAGGSYRGSFIVAPEQQLPKVPAELYDPLLPPAVQRTSQDAWLSAADGGVWALEAYLRTFEVSQNYGPARDLQQALAEGRTIRLRKISASSR